MKRYIILMAALFLTGCQTLDSVQYIAPATRNAELKSRLAALAESFNMTDRTEQSRVPSTVLYYRLGDCSFTDLGVRERNRATVVDLQFRSAGIGGKEYKRLKPEVEGILRDLHGDRVTVIRDRSKQIPMFEGKPNNQMQNIGTTAPNSDL